MMHIEIWNMGFFSLVFYTSLWTRTFGKGIRVTVTVFHFVCLKKSSRRRKMPNEQYAANNRSSRPFSLLELSLAHLIRNNQSTRKFLFRPLSLLLPSITFLRRERSCWPRCLCSLCRWPCIEHLFRLLHVILWLRRGHWVDLGCE
ncbi:uncharacterized protein BO72DRAFT_67681 [Aspergillus fijiensis CBS 313.89]|uniref:Uncharacterized protein n=1 Tax=Aspergillus fijiensis CBS 313.89 TaxID=1448319 RepID=A0A8G1RXL3_9EURO|nr:uncharacterized protein BO72DRAFT_67681 [Aspergillus fijiensis CBS 313.89]RAK78666.1 hypothetical protein BO72DRAFT_67681 [Aspergillus fijiensis CBS 313.89]